MESPRGLSCMLNTKLNARSNKIIKCLDRRELFRVSALIWILPQWSSLHPEKQCLKISSGCKNWAFHTINATGSIPSAMTSPKTPIRAASLSLSIPQIPSRTTANLHHNERNRRLILRSGRGLRQTALSARIDRTIPSFSFASLGDICRRIELLDWLVLMGKNSLDQYSLCNTSGYKALIKYVTQRKMHHIIPNQTAVFADTHYKT